jgi:hypothetical protein
MYQFIVANAWLLDWLLSTKCFKYFHFYVKVELTIPDYVVVILMNGWLHIRKEFLPIVCRTNLKMLCTTLL